MVHTPDLLSLHVDGSVTLWDARPRGRHDDSFLLKAELTAEACRRAGWRHAVFEGLPTPTRMNLLWLNGYRRPLPWHSRWRSELESLLHSRTRRVEELRARDDGSGELIATVWHLIATGMIACDLSRPIRDSSTLSWSESHAEPRECEIRGLVSPLVLDTASADVLVWTRRRRADR